MLFANILINPTISKLQMFVTPLYLSGAWLSVNPLGVAPNDHCLLSSLIAAPATANPPPETSTPPVVVNSTSKPSVGIVDKQPVRAERKTSLRLILGVVFGPLVVILAVFIVVFIIARRKRSPRLE